jgi:hypothetical protein
MKPINTFSSELLKRWVILMIIRNEFWSGIFINVAVCTILDWSSFDLHQKRKW